MFNGCKYNEVFLICNREKEYFYYVIKHYFTDEYISYILQYHFILLSYKIQYVDLGYHRRV